MTTKGTVKTPGQNAKAVSAPSTPKQSMTRISEMDKLFDDFVGSRFFSPERWDRPFSSFMRDAFDRKLPRMDVIDRENEIIVRADVAGFDRDDLDISLSDGSLTIKGESSRESKHEDGEYYRCEITQGAFSRTVALPGSVDSAQARAELKDGILELTLPKNEKDKRHKITIE